jgi:flagella basal body P-ring formation protein FlgA
MLTRASGPVALVLAALAAAADAQSVTPVRAIRSHTLLAAEDLVLAEASVPGAVAAIAQAVGQEARVTLYPGRPILAAQIGAPALVERNQLVRMTYASGALRIATEGRALDRAGAGEPVRVMNLASRQIVTGAVAADGSIEVGR